jgi:hypothetical protein
MSTATATATKTYTFEELPSWSVIEVKGKCYRKQSGPDGADAHNMNAACGGPVFLVWNEFRPADEQYKPDGYGSYEIAE